MSSRCSPARSARSAFAVGLVDATYMESSIPSRHTPTFTVDAGVRLVTPNDLVHLAEAPAGFTILGCGKTAMDTCNWLLDAGVDPDRIEWIRPRDPWLFNRALHAAIGPRRLVHADASPLGRGMCRSGERPRFRAPPGSRRRVRADRRRRRAERVSRRHDQHASRSTRSPPSSESYAREESGASEPTASSSITTNALPTRSRVYVDCTAAGIPSSEPIPVFAGDRITLQLVTIGIVPWTTATIGAVEALRDDDIEKNRLCPPLTFTGDIVQVLRVALTGMTGLAVRSAEPDLAAWNARCRLDPSRAAGERANDPDVAAAFTTIATNFGPAMENLARYMAASVATT